MLSSREAFENDVCPVGDELLGSLYRASEHGLPQLVESVSADVRAMLALFCYKRAHLHSMSLAIAATCSERDLVEQGGIVGSTLFASPGSSDTGSPLSALMRAAHHLQRVLDMPPFPGPLGLAVFLAFHRALRRLGDGLRAVHFHQLPGVIVNFRLAHASAPSFKTVERKTSGAADSFRVIGSRRWNLAEVPQG